MPHVWREVFVPMYLVASNDFETHVGGQVTLALELSCRHRTAALGPPPTASVAWVAGSHGHPDSRGRHEMVGQAVPTESCVWRDGWIFDVDGLPMYVTEVDDVPPGQELTDYRREHGSDPVMPVPAPGTWVRVRGQLSIAEDHVTGGFEPEAALLAQAERQWSVQRIVKLYGPQGPRPPYHGQADDIQAIRYRDLRRDDSISGYLLDLTQAV